MKWATAHLSTGWVGRRARNTAQAQTRARRGHRSAGAGAVGRQAQALGRGRAGREGGVGVQGTRGAQACGALRRAGCSGVARARGARPAGRLGRAAGRAAGPAGCALGAHSLFLARFDSVFFRSQIFGHCS